jgi:hypothetical protein
MTTADWALIISLCSAAISLAGFVWNVWSKFIYPKPRVRVSFNFMTTVGSGAVRENVLCLSATNMGPGPVTLHSAVLRKRTFLRTKGYALLNPLHNYPAQTGHSVGPFGGGLPKKVEVGEQFSVYFTAYHDGLAADEFDQIGFHDLFGRNHWAQKRQLRTAVEFIKRHIAEEDARRHAS